MLQLVDWEARGLDEGALPLLWIRGALPEPHNLHQARQTTVPHFRTLLRTRVLYQRPRERSQKNQKQRAQILSPVLVLAHQNDEAHDVDLLVLLLLLLRVHPA